MKEYIDLAKDVLANGKYDENKRTGQVVRRVFGRMLRISLEDGLPVITTKYIHTKSVIAELVWFLSGKCHNTDFLKKHGVKIWDLWADKEGCVGPIYGCQWRKWGGYHGEIDQLQYVIEILQNDSTSRRMLVSSWNVSDLPYMALPPCHWSFQLFCEREKLSMMVNQRSADLFIGLPFNITSYAILCNIIAKMCDKILGDLIFSLGDVHIYQSHIPKIMDQIEREPYCRPSLYLSSGKEKIEDFGMEDIKIKGYNHHPKIVAEVYK